MWTAIRAELPTPRPARRTPAIVWVPALLAAGVAGLVIGRTSAPVPPAPEVEEVAQLAEPESGERSDPAPIAEADPEPSVAELPVETPILSDFRFVTNLHLLEVGPLLTRLAGGADPEAGTVPGEIRDQARTLLDGTRFLLAEPEPLDPELMRLLEDLEFLLVQVVGLPASESEAARVEIELIAEGMSEQRILPRIHTFARDGAEQ
ncbi:MAG: hypothetical protein EA351_01025 [Gemmatimonadales bacterium]|nr:MAG: hypothetical protein EA351_01025 [Gemmatimonadales bacterium]